jgi:hypothetical protein
MALVTEPLWWAGSEVAGLGFGAIYRKLRGAGLSVEEATQQATQQAIARRPLGPERGRWGDNSSMNDEDFYFSGGGRGPNATDVLGATPVKESSPLAKLQGITVDATDVTNLEPKSLTSATRSSYFENKPIEQPESSFFRSSEAYSTPEAQSEITNLLQKDEAATQINQMLEPTTAANKLYAPTREPIVFDKEEGPFPRFVKDGGSFRTTDEFGTDLEPGLYGSPRRMDEFGIENVDNLPDINTFSHGPYDDPRDAAKKLLDIQTDPKTMLKIYIPKDEQINNIIDQVGLTPREIEPPLDRFQIKALKKPENVKKLDLIDENQNLTTTKLLELPDSELETLTSKEDFVMKPIKFFTVEDGPLAVESKKLITKMGFTTDDVTEMEGMVDNMMKNVKEAAINQNLPQEEFVRARQQLWEDLIKKRMRPC